jgi:hypothetical protein
VRLRENDGRNGRHEQRAYQAIHDMVEISEPLLHR